MFKNSFSNPHGVTFLLSVICFLILPFPSDQAYTLNPYYTITTAVIDSNTVANVMTYDQINSILILASASSDNLAAYSFSSGWS